MASTSDLVPPVDGLDLLVNGGEFVLVRIQDREGERIRIGIRDSAVRLLLVVRPRVNRAQFVVVLAGVIVTILVAFAVPVGIGLPALLGFAIAIAVGLVGLVVVLLSQPKREYRFHDDLPGGRDREPLLTLIERSGQQAWYALRDEQGRMIGDISRRLGKWRVRGYEPIEPPEPTADEQEPAVTGKVSSLASTLHALSLTLEDEPMPKGVTAEVGVVIVRDYLNMASIIGGMISGPLGLMLAFSGPWKRMEFRRGGSVVATGHRLDDGNAVRLEIGPGLDLASESDAWLDRRHLLALAVLSLSLEAER